jgi:hypothetical protein
MVFSCTRYFAWNNAKYVLNARNPKSQEEEVFLGPQNCGGNQVRQYSMDIAYMGFYLEASDEIERFRLTPENLS